MKAKKLFPLLAVISLALTGCTQEASSIPEPSASSSGTNDFIPESSSEIKAYAACLESNDVKAEVSSDIIFAKPKAGSGGLQPAKGKCTAERDDFAQIVASTDRKENPRTSFQQRVTSCLIVSKAGTWNAEREDPVLLDDGTDARVPAIRKCLKANMNAK